MRTVVQDGFDEGFYDWKGVAELTIPLNWKLYYLEAPGQPSVLHRVECDEKYMTPEVRNPDERRHSSVSIATESATHEAALYRTFEVEPGEVYRASVWAMNIMFDGVRSGHGLVLGIDPTGGDNYFSDSVVWSDWWSQDMREVWESRKWQHLSVATEAKSDRITVFLRTKNRFARSAYAHFDDFLLEVEAPEEPGTGPVVDSNIVAQLKRIADILEARQTSAVSRFFARLRK